MMILGDNFGRKVGGYNPTGSYAYGFQRHCQAHFDAQHHTGGFVQVLSPEISKYRWIRNCTFDGQRSDCHVSATGNACSKTS